MNHPPQYTHCYFTPAKLSQGMIISQYTVWRYFRPLDRRFIHVPGLLRKEAIIYAVVSR